MALINIGIKVNIVWISEWYIDALIIYWLYHLRLQPININRNYVIKNLDKYTFSHNSKDPIKKLDSLSDEKLSILEQITDKFWELDITQIKWEDLIDRSIDLFTYSFPCLDISIQWKQKGFKKGYESRSWLLWQIERVLTEMKAADPKKLPKILLMENVKAIVWKKFKEDLDEWINVLDALWYESSEPFVLNSKSVWAAQSRDRAFIVSILKTEKSSKLVKDIFKKIKIEEEIKNFNKWTISDIFEKDVEHEIFKKTDKMNYLHTVNKKETSIKKGFIENYTKFNSENYFYYLDDTSPTITASWAQSRIKVWDGEKIVFLTSKEHLLLQWFNPKIYDIMKEYKFSDNKIKHLAWNSINVKVLEYIFKKII